MSHALILPVAPKDCESYFLSRQKIVKPHFRPSQLFRSYQDDTELIKPQVKKIRKCNSPFMTHFTLLLKRISRK